MKRLLIATAFLAPSIALAQESQQPKDMVISGQAVMQLGAALNETPMKYAMPMLKILESGLHPLEPQKPDKPAETPKPESK